MVNKPIYHRTRTPDQEALIEKRRAKLADFFRRYPTPLRAWVERQDRKEVWWMYQTMKEPGLSAAKVLCLFEGRGFKIPSNLKLRGYWFRASLSLVDGETMTVQDVAGLFGLPRSTYMGLVEKEKEWEASRLSGRRARKTKAKRTGPRYRRARLNYWPIEQARILEAGNRLLEHKVR